MSGRCPAAHQDGPAACCRLSPPDRATLTAPRWHTRIGASGGWGGANLFLSTADIPTKTQLEPVGGETSFLTLDDLRARRMNEVAFVIARCTLEKYFHDDDGNPKPWGSSRNSYPSRNAGLRSVSHSKTTPSHHCCSWWSSPTTPPTGSTRPSSPLAAAPPP